jgi:ribulose-5-phosphate 4-epimerase/fuculose-1-phosphate aldolase
MLITATGVSLGDTTPANLVEVEVATYACVSPAGHQPSKEYRYHADILRMRPEIGAVLHVHPPHVTAFAVKQRDIPMLTDAAFKQRPIPRVSFAPSGSDVLQQRVAETVAANPGCAALLLEQHGLVTLGATVVSAFYLADLVEELAHVAYLAGALENGNRRSS